MQRPPVQPTAAFMIAKLSRLVALAFGAGLAPVAPGTVGTLWAWAVWLVVNPRDAGLLVPAGLVLSFAVGVWACGRTARALGVADHGAIVWDEVVAFWVVLWLAPPTLAAQAVAFLLFRGFDIVKPPPIRHFDQTMKGGFGVMFDDLLAAGYTLLVMAAWDALGR